MKVYLISIQYIPNITGGGGVVVKELSRELVKAGYDVTVLTLGLKDKPEEVIELEDESGKYKVKVIRFFTSDSDEIANPYEGTKWDEFKRFEELSKKFFEYIKDKDGLIHLHGHYIIPALSKRIKEEGKKNPTLVTFSALESVALRKHNFNDMKAIEYIARLEEVALKYCDFAIVNSVKVKNQLKDMYPKAFNNKKVIVLPNYVEKYLLFAPITSLNDLIKLREKYAIDKDSRIIFHVGRIDKIKGIDYLIKAMDIVGSKINLKISLIIAGFLEKKQAEFFSHLEDLSKKVMDNYPNIQIKLIINIDSREKIHFFDACDFFITPAIIEPFGLTTLEAWARGKAVIRSDNEGSRYLFNIKKNINPPFVKKKEGIIVNFEKNRDKNLASAIIELLTHSDERIKMGLMGKKRVHKKYTWKERLKIYKKIYESVKS
ncbi:MAG: glycosyltransferase family 4 protein [Candidatus Helarchaeota archaeon]